jgi:hypothetical protein
MVYSELLVVAGDVQFAAFFALVELQKFVVGPSLLGQIKQRDFVEASLGVLLSEFSHLIHVVVGRLCAIVTHCQVVRRFLNLALGPSRRFY